MSAIVVLVFVLVKFTEGAWLVVILFAVGVPALIRLNREYKEEAGVLARIGSRPKPPEPPTYARRTVFVFVDEFDLAAVAALRYARSLRPTTLRAVHFVIDSAVADTLRQDWVRANTGITLDFVDCADRRLARCAAELVSAEADLPGVGVTAVLPRRTYSSLLGRLLHDRTADRMAAAVSRIPHAAATIVPFDVRGRLQEIYGRRGTMRGRLPGARRPRPAGGALAEAGPPAGAGLPDGPGAGQPGGAPEPVSEPAADGAADDAVHMAAPEAAVADAAADRAESLYDRPAPPPGVRTIGSLTGPGKATVEGRVYAVEIRPVERNTVLAAEVADSTGQLTALFYGRSHIPGLDCGTRVRFRGQVGMRPGGPVMINPAYELLAPGTAEPAPGNITAGDDQPGGGGARRRGGPRRRKDS
jgi:hypothetical protein